MNRIAWCLVGVLALSLGFNGWLYYKNDRMAHTVLLIDQKDKLQQQQMNEFTLIMYNKTNENIAEVARQQGKIEGMLAVIHNIKPDATEHSSIWHAGYHRGLDQSADMKKIEAEYATEKDAKIPKKK
jgi:hypothetical protein